MVRTRRTAWVWWLLAAAALSLAIWREMAKHARSSPVAPPSPAAPSPVIPEPEPLPPAIDAASEPPLYTVTEALDDLRSGPLAFVGTGEWFGNFSIHACAYRNERVIVVNNYCTANETPAFELIVLSPTRGRVSVYAEAEKAISTLARGDYLTFRVEAAPAVVETLELGFTYAALRAWDERRYNTGSRACWVGIGERAACSADLASRRANWAKDSEPFVASPPDAWFQLVKDLHVRAVRDSRAGSH